MWEKIMEVSTGVYVLWGLGVLGLLLKILANAYMSGMVRASGNMAETNRRKLRSMRQQYENKRSFGLCGGDEEAYAESFVRNLKFLAKPMEFWNRSGTVLALTVCGVMAGAYIYYGRAWRGSPDMQFFFANSIIVCAFLLALDNIFVINNKVEILKANIRGYLERLPKPREETRPKIKRVFVKQEQSEDAPEPEMEIAGGVDEGVKNAKNGTNRNVNANSMVKETSSVRGKRRSSKHNSSKEKQRMRESEANRDENPVQEAGSVKASASEQEKESAASEETLNRFLAEFFSQ